MRLILLLLVAASASAQPTAPQLTVNGEGRFEFATIPEVVLVRGIAQVVQLGFYQLDPGNPWPAGDVERASNWASKRFTQLVDAQTGQGLNPNIAQYDTQTGELTYAGQWSGDVTLRIREQGGAAQSEPFRLRVLTPTMVYGDNAAAINTQKQWAAKVCLPEHGFVACRQGFVGGASDAAPLVVYITPGTYGNQDWFMSQRRFIYVLGDPANRPTLSGDAISGAKKEMFYIANLNLRDTNIQVTGALESAPNTLIVRSVYQCCESGQQSGVINPHTSANLYPIAVYWHASESKSMGGTGNTQHSAYVEQRPKSTFDVNNLRVLGSRGSSALKTTVGQINVRHSLLQVAESLDQIEDGTCGGSTTHGCLMHTPVDFPGYTSAVIYANRFVLWRGPTVGVPVGRSGILAGAIFIRQRGPSLGSDVPNYPNLSWNPPQTSQTTKQSPCLNWEPGPATFVADNFWTDVRAKPLADPANPCTFKHFVSFNRFEQVSGSLPVWALRDDGTYPASAVTQFSAYVKIKRNHPNWAERSTTFWFSNTRDGAMHPGYKLDDQPNVAEIEPLAFWPRQGPDDYPRVVEIAGELPSWFRL